jgi:hypothetical protein
MAGEDARDTPAGAGDLLDEEGDLPTEAVVQHMPVCSRCADTF